MPNNKVHILLLVVSFIVIACSSMREISTGYTTETPTVVQESTVTPSATHEVIETVSVSETPTPVILYEAEVLVDHLRLRHDDGSDSGEFLNAGDRVTVVEEVSELTGVEVPDPPGGMWCLIEPRELGDWVACTYLLCTRHCDIGD
ncbi:MAG: hypothetical protein ACXABY_08790 [Candidatus Thorarchaeota archaeon]|jgi:hypothetical protein